MVSEHRTKIIVALIGAGAVVLAAAVAAVFGLFTGSGKQDNDNCSAQGNNNSITCGDRRAASPSVTVVAGLDAETWSLRLRNWEPNTTVSLSVADPAGNEQAMGKYGQRQVSEDGTADSQDRHYFWKHEPGEPVGVYTLTVRGTDADGDAKTRRSLFTVR